MHSTSELRLAVVGLGYVGLPLAVEFGKTPSGRRLRHQRARIAALRGGHDVTRELIGGGTAQRQAADVLDQARRSRRLQRLHRHRADADRRRQAARSRAADRRSRDHRQGAEAGRHRHLRIDRLSRRDRRRSACRCWSSRLRPEVQRRFLRRLQPRAHQSRRQAAPRRRRSRRSPPGSTPEVADLVDALYGADHHRRHPQGAEHQGGRSRQGDREHPARPQHRAGQRTRASSSTKLGIDTEAVLQAAGTKWNFLPFRPGLVGGHCIGVDPYYLTHKAQAIGYHPEIILAGRRLNDGMGPYVVRSSSRRWCKRASMSWARASW